MSYSDEYDEFSELPMDPQGLAAYSVHERTVKRRSSKGDLHHIPPCMLLKTSQQPAISVASPSANVNALDPMNHAKVV